MNKLIRFMKNISFFLYFLFVIIAIYFFANDNQELGKTALLWATGYIVAEYGFLSILKSRLLDIKQKNYKIIFLYKNRKSAEEMIQKVNEMEELKKFLEEPNVSACHFMDYQLYQRLNPNLAVTSFPYYLVINGENLISDGILLKKPLFHHSSKEEVIEFLSKQYKEINK
jgi:hypothetical protein